MSLINCPECEKQVSDKAANCPNCGYPIHSTTIQINVSFNKDEKEDENQSETTEADLMEEPSDPQKTHDTKMSFNNKTTSTNSPKDLNIGQAVTAGWKRDAILHGMYDLKENVVYDIPQGKISISLHRYGIEISKKLTYYNIHNSQLISTKSISRSELLRTNQLIQHTYEKDIEKYYLVINYRDKKTLTAQTLFIQGKKTNIDKFIARHLKEKYINETENRPAGQYSTPKEILQALIITIGIILLIIYMLQ